MLLDPTKYIDANLRLVDDMKMAIFKQIKYDLQIKFVIPLKNIFETDFKEILIDIGYLDSPENSSLVAIKSNYISIIDLEENDSINFACIHSERLNQYFLLNYNSCSSPVDYQKHLEQLYNAFKETIHRRFSISGQQLNNLEKLSEIKSVISEIINRFQLVENPQQAIYFKTDTNTNLKQVLFDLSLQNRISEFQTILQSFLSIQYQFLKDALALIESKIELLKYSIEIKNITLHLKIIQIFFSHLKIKSTLISQFLNWHILYRCLNDEKSILQERNKASLYRKISRKAAR